MFSILPGLRGKPLMCAIAAASVMVSATVHAEPAGPTPTTPTTPETTTAASPPASSVTAVQPAKSEPSIGATKFETGALPGAESGASSGNANISATAPATAATPAAALPNAIATDAATNSQPSGSAAAPQAPTVKAAEAPADQSADIAAAIKDRVLTDTSVVSKFNAADVKAVAEYNTAHMKPVWITAGRFTAKADAVIATLRSADDWGLEASDYSIPTLASQASVDAQAEADVRLTLAVLSYARHAQAGRVNPMSVSNIWDMSPDVKDPYVLLSDLVGSETPEKTLIDLHPQHKDFKGLQQALVKLRKPEHSEVVVDAALTVRLPARGKMLKLGVTDDDVVLLRKRLKAPADDPAKADLFDEALDVAVRAFQDETRVKTDGIVGTRTRAALNGELETEKPSKDRDISRILINMERWRWLPHDLGDFYVMSNTPEFVGTVVKNGETVFKERVIVGLPTWPTPMLESSLKRIVFSPSWGVPDGIKTKELLPRLRRASGGGGFFEQMFGGGTSGGARVLAAYGLKPSLNGRPVNANSVNWNNVDIRRYSFVQPPGGSNPLGKVKFRFPNRHDVYMHDTTQRSLFNQSSRALSHGCIRVQNPERLAEVILAHDKGWSADKVSSQFRGGTSDVALTTAVPVYLTYFTARADENGKIEGFRDIYGNDRRLLAALSGGARNYSDPEPSRSYDDDGETPVASSSSQKRKKKTNYAYQESSKSGNTTGDLISNALSGLLNN